MYRIRYPFSKSRRVLGLLAILIVIYLLFFRLNDRPSTSIELSPYPNGKDFAFTITDDPDGTRLKAVRPIYNFLSRIGIRSTIAVWLQNPDRSDGFPDTTNVVDEGDSCQNNEYLDFIKTLQNKHFEIAMHTASSGNDTREKTISGYEQFKSFFGSYPKINIMHSKNLENIYWGKKVVQNWLMKLMIGLSSKKARFPFSGELSASKYFWGDICKANTKYVRLWGTSDINTLKFNPSMPYHDPQKPYVNYWFSFSDGYDVNIFNKLISDKNLRKLENQRGACIVYTHFSAHFSEKDDNGQYRLNKEFETQISKLAKNKQGWFVPASTLLDRLLLMKNVNIFPFKNGIVVSNSNTEAVDHITLISSPGLTLYSTKGNEITANDQGEMVIDQIIANGSLTFYYKNNHTFTKKEQPGLFENMNLVFQRILIYIKQRIL